MFNQAAAVNPVSFALFARHLIKDLGAERLSRPNWRFGRRFWTTISPGWRPAPLGRHAGTTACVSVIEHHKPRLLAIPTDRGYLGRGTALTRAVRRGHRELLFKGEYLAGHGMPHTLAAALFDAPRAHARTSPAGIPQV